MLLAIVPGLLEVTATGLAAFTAAGIQQIAYSLTPDPSMGDTQSLVDMRSYAAAFGQTSRATLESWSNDTFSGKEDSQNNTILNYLAGGSYVENTNIPSNSEIEDFYKKQLLSRTINAQWKTRRIFTLFSKTDNTSDTSGPSQTRYYSDGDGGVYYTYLYHEDSVLKGHLDKPWGLDQLNASDYNIAGSVSELIYNQLEPSNTA
ncbi:uncharacterized protein K441DRAFT_104822 [Cenococcum geophilum 1.58]|uniref:uncharacterized protein n=1 Tax=Cenococcum geophilum 1.58 TaxID=794803 RepID=UPI00358E5937|nr:hypothetical protein K441DRAFT_104822 [Cenococcum geophilum 1.58]